MEPTTQAAGMGGAEAALLGCVQGLSEFLPISSSGHLIVFQELLGVEQQGLLFAVALHVATLGSVLIFYRRRVAELVTGVLRGRVEAFRYVGKLGVATLPAVAAALLAREAVEAQFQQPRVAGLGLLFTGAILWTTRYTLRSAQRPEPGWGAALLIGCAQVVAMLPGVSRSGSTVAAALALGVAPLAAAEFSFLMSAAAILGAAIHLLPQLSAAPENVAAALSFGVLAAFVSGVAAIWLFVRLLRTRHFHRFAYYTWIVGALFLVWLRFGGSG